MHTRARAHTHTLQLNYETDVIISQLNKEIPKFIFTCGHNPKSLTSVGIN